MDFFYTESEAPPNATEIEKEHMFDKVVTPSDVGKLNRLVIPKQHAEKYFPLDSSTNDKGLLLTFNDTTGKSWRFRYSYWNSSQSYVMTKGWSRFVKEKKLDAGDIVSFHRGKSSRDRDRLFIDWRRRPDVPPPIHRFGSLLYPWAPPSFNLLQQQSRLMMMRHHYHYPTNYNYNYGYNYSAGSNMKPVLYTKKPDPVVAPVGAKRLRLFGVTIDPEAGDDCEILVLSDSNSGKGKSLELDLQI